MKLLVDGGWVDSQPKVLHEGVWKQPRRVLVLDGGHWKLAWASDVSSKT